MQNDNFMQNANGGWQYQYQGWPYHPGGLAPNGACPHCGRCPHCGQQTRPYIYWQGNVMGQQQQVTLGSPANTGCNPNSFSTFEVKLGASYD